MVFMRARTIGNEVRRRYAIGLQKYDADRFAFLRLYVDQEVIRCVRIERLLPFVADRSVRTNVSSSRTVSPRPKCDHLHGTVAAPACHVRQSVTPRNSHAAAGPAHQRTPVRALQHTAQPETSEHSRPAQSPASARHRLPGTSIISDCQQRAAGNQQPRWWWRHLVMTQHTQRRRVAQLNKRRQGKADQQDQGAAAGQQHWRESRPAAVRRWITSGQHVGHNFLDDRSQPGCRSPPPDMPSSTKLHECRRDYELSALAPRLFINATVSILPMGKTPARTWRWLPRSATG